MQLYRNSTQFFQSLNMEASVFPIGIVSYGQYESLALHAYTCYFTRYDFYKYFLSTRQRNK